MVENLDSTFIGQLKGIQGCYLEKYREQIKYVNMICSNFFNDLLNKRDGVKQLYKENKEFREIIKKRIQILKKNYLNNFAKPFFEGALKIRKEHGLEFSF